MATVAMWRRSRISTAAPGDRPSLVVQRPGGMGEPDNPYRTSFARQAEREASLGERAGTASLMLGRAIFGGYFLYSGIKHFRNAEMMAGYAGSKGIPAPKAAVIGSGALIALGGLSLLLGVKPKAGAGLIGAFLVGVTPAMHNFWKQEDPGAKMNEQVHFMKNLALIGGASLAAAVPEPWPVSAGNH
jgi:putative oxidoreductase